MREIDGLRRRPPLRRPPRQLHGCAVHLTDPGRTEGFRSRQPSPQAIKKAPQGAVFMTGGEGGIDGLRRRPPLPASRLRRCVALPVSCTATPFI